MTNRTNADVAKRLADPTGSAIIVAEIGSNFDGSLDQAKRLIQVAAQAGCDFAKFQIFRADWLVQENSPAHEVLAPLELPREWIPDLIAECENAGIGFCASPFDEEAVSLLVENDAAPFIKIASPEVHDLPLIRASARTGSPIFLSTGLMTAQDIEIAVSCIRKTRDVPLCILHCVSDYPTAPADCNLGMIDWLSKTFGVPIGFSDHSQHTSIPVAAVALGARVIEKHITLDNSLDGPDHHFALEPQPLNEMVSAIRNVEAALGKTTSYPVKYEAEKRLINRKVLVAKQIIPPGTVVNADMLAVKRARSGILPRDIAHVVGKSTRREIAQDETLEEDQF